VLHLLSGLEIGGKEAACLRLARRGIGEGGDHRLVVFDTDYRSSGVDFDPAGVPYQFIPRHGGLDLGFARQIARHLKCIRPGIIHAYNDTAAFYAAAALKWGNPSSAKLVVAFHTYPSHSSLGARLLTRWGCSTANAVVAVSHALKSRLLGAGWTKQCNVIPNGVDLDRPRASNPSVDWRRRLQVPADAILVGHIGRFDEIKRHRDLISAAKILESECPEIIITCVGQGPLAGEMQRAASDCRNLRFIPQITPATPFLRALDIFVLCSDYEAAPLTLLEAMACGVPSVVTSVGGIPEIVGMDRSATCAMQVKPRSPGDLAQALKRLSRNQGERTKLGLCAQKRSLNYSFEKEWQAYSELYS